MSGSLLCFVLLFFYQNDTIDPNVSGTGTLYRSGPDVGIAVCFVFSDLVNSVFTAGDLSAFARDRFLFSFGFVINSGG